MGREEYQKKIRKSIITLLITNITFFGIFGFWMWYDVHRMSGWRTSSVALLFLPSCLVFAIWYGVFSYRKTRKPWLSNIIFVIFEIIFFTFICVKTNILESGAASLYIYIFTSISLISSFTVKSKIDKKEKANEKQED